MLILTAYVLFYFCLFIMHKYRHCSEIFVSRLGALTILGRRRFVLKTNGEDTSVISPTLGFNIKTINYQKYTLNIYDVGCQKTITSYWRNYFEQTDGLFWVVDGSDLRRLDDCKMELDNLLKEERLSGASLLILANKQDITGDLTPEEIAKSHDIAYFSLYVHFRQRFLWLKSESLQRIHRRQIVVS
ncbi:hypothetical protein K2173_011423 [Erythroxylum novogranatense]|uniref:ADP-ribosylation factor n=1 Tax=Erythroxylum novogranatense TaxID=1862640 RepID=A0AAV8S6E9_9ROSI|nr:hypothetical protein K2173_011423 [Erythroxylum novogranatense]